MITWLLITSVIAAVVWVMRPYIEVWVYFFIATILHETENTTRKLFLFTNHVILSDAYYIAQSWSGSLPPVCTIGNNQSDRNSSAQIQLFKLKTIDSSSPQLVVLSGFAHSVTGLVQVNPYVTPSIPDKYWRNSKKLSAWSVWCLRDPINWVGSKVGPAFLDKLASKVFSSFSSLR